MAYWTESRYADHCRECEQPIREGDRILLDGGPYCSECGQDIKPDPLNGADSGGPKGPGALRGRLL